ncbi:DUF3077 domain-containing protein [Pseudomonas sp. NPDC012596]|uniref:DUF3077 domain-containing protein n=1 Tax=Pseudomonas sp. NPDC012596 TaxID=3364419 RepID=UPI0036C8F6FA
MPTDTLPTSANPDHRFVLSQRLFTVIPETPATLAKAQAAKLMDCARHLNHTGVMLGDQRMVAASHHLNTMVRALLDQLEGDRPPLSKPS